MSITLNPQINHFLSNDKIITAQPQWQYLLPTVMALPRAQQWSTLQKIRLSVMNKKSENTSDNNKAGGAEEWNTNFSSTSLYEALSKLTFMQQIYKVNRQAIYEALKGRQNWHIVEIGGGNGEIWREFEWPTSSGSFTLIDINQNSQPQVSRYIPQHVKFNSIISPVEEADIPEADIILCSLCIHHIPGLSQEQREEYGFSGPGKLEVLEKFIKALKPRKGICILAECDNYSEIDLDPGNPILIDNILDEYVRRAGMAIVIDNISKEISCHNIQLMIKILEHWMIDEVQKAFVSVQERDIYELDVAHWLLLIEQAGAELLHHQDRKSVV